MLALLNKQDPPNEWIEGIEIAIENSMKVLKDRF